MKRLVYARRLVPPFGGGRVCDNLTYKAHFHQQLLAVKNEFLPWLQKKHTNFDSNEMSSLSSLMNTNTEMALKVHDSCVVAISADSFRAMYIYIYIYVVPQIAHQLLRASTHLHIMSFVVAQNQRIHKDVHT